jgi:hypothetical protein
MSPFVSKPYVHLNFVICNVAHHPSLDGQKLTILLKTQKVLVKCVFLFSGAQSSKLTLRLIDHPVSVPPMPQTVATNRTAYVHAEQAGLQDGLVLSWPSPAAGTRTSGAFVCF